VIGSHVRLDFNRVTRDEFEAKRLEYHRDLQEDFFERFEIAGTRIHVMRRGDSLWSLAERKYRVPIWLLRQYNPDLGFEGLPAGTRVTIPQIEPHTDV
jgi:membrane-bound lytic murein transglycosylase D